MPKKKKKKVFKPKDDDLTYCSLKKNQKNKTQQERKNENNLDFILEIVYTMESGINEHLGMSVTKWVDLSVSEKAEKRHLIKQVLENPTMGPGEMATKSKCNPTDRLRMFAIIPTIHTLNKLLQEKH